MFLLAIAIGLYSYVIFFIGIFGYLYADIITFLTILFIVVLLVTGLWYLLPHLSLVIKKNRVTNFLKFPRDYKTLKQKKLFYLLSALISLLALINLIGALSPELAFDALWYHLTIPKIFLENHKVFYIPGSLFYYSAMPKLGEMLYIAALAIQGEILAKLMHFTAGLLVMIVLYRLGRLYLSTLLSLLVVLIFYSNPVAAWESTTAYIDLFRTLYELLAFYAFLIWIRTNRARYLYLSSLMSGFAVCAKLLSFGSLIIFTALMLYRLKENAKNRVNLQPLLSKFNIPAYWLLSLISASPWMIFSYITTSNPVYPIFSFYNIDYSWSILSPFNFIQEVFHVLLFADDPLSPIYLMTIPLAVYYYRKSAAEYKIITLYSLLALIIWYFTPRTGGGRFLLPYLPVFSLTCGICIVKTRKNKLLYRYLITIVVLLAVVTLSYRTLASRRYISYLSGSYTKDEFLTDNLNFSFGDFYDTDGYFKSRINKTDKVLLYGFHNLYYINFPFIHSSYAAKGDRFNYIALQRCLLPGRFNHWTLVYSNELTGVELYYNEGKFEIY